VKIAIVTPVNPPPNQGGLQVVTQLLAEALRRRGNIVDIFSPKEIRYSWNVFGGIDFLGDLRNPPDIFHVQQCDLSVRYAFLLKKKYPDIPVVTTVHGMFAVDPFRYCKIRLSPSEPARQLLRIIPGRYFEKESVRASDYVIAVSEDLERACKEIRKDTRVFTVPNGIDLGQFRQREYMQRGDSYSLLKHCLKFLSIRMPKWSLLEVTIRSISVKFLNGQASSALWERSK